MQMRSSATTKQVTVDLNVSRGTKWEPMTQIIERAPETTTGGHSTKSTFCLGPHVYSVMRDERCLISRWNSVSDELCSMSFTKDWMAHDLQQDTIDAGSVISQEIRDLKLNPDNVADKGATSTIVARESIIRGYSDGSVKGFNIPSGQLVWEEAGAHTGPVSCLWLPSEYALPGMRSCFLSAGNDGKITVWDLELHKPVHTFHQHTGSITHLFGAPSLKSNDPRWRSTFFSVSLDRSVGLFSLQNYECVQIFLGHSEEITSVRWRNDLDVLIVGSWDDKICVWDLGSGLLEQRLDGEAAALVKSTCENSLKPIRHQSTNGPLTTTSVYTQFGESPVQMLSLNLDSLFTYLNALPNLESLYADFYYQCCSFFIPWDLVSAELTESLAQLNLKPSTLNLCGAFGSSMGYTVLSPLASSNSGMYTNSPALSASFLLAGMTFAQWMLAKCHDDDKTKCSELLSLFGTTLPEKVAYWKGGGVFVEPSLEVLANSWQSEDENVRISARSLFTSTLKRLPAATLAAKCETFVSRMKQSAPQSESRSKAVMVLGILGSWADSPLKPGLAKFVARELLKMLYQQRDAVVAAELLGSGYITWSKALGDPSVVQKLFEMSLQHDRAFLAETCKKTLLMIATIQPQQFVLAMVTLMSTSSSIQERSASLLLMRTCARQDAASLLPQLPQLIDAIVACLDPAVPNLRTGCMSAATSLLDLLVKRFPMLDFYHKQPQYLALGAAGMVIIYDMQSAVKWHQLKGHKGPIMAVKFSPNGKSIASYSFADGMVKLWSITSSFFGFGSSPHCTKTLNVGMPARGQARPSTSRLLDTVRFQWKTEQTLILKRANAEPIKIALHLVGNSPESGSAYCTICLVSRQWHSLASENKSTLLSKYTLSYRSEKALRKHHIHYGYGSKHRLREKINVKSVLVGEGAVGKTCYFMTCPDGKFPADYVPTCISNPQICIHYKKDLPIVDLGLWDTAGQRDYDRLRPLSYPQTDVFLYCFTMEPKRVDETLDRLIDQLIPETEAVCPDPKGILVGLKSDLKGNDDTLYQRATDLAESRGYSYIEVSSLCGSNVVKLLLEIARLVLEPDKNGHGQNRKCILQ